MKLLIRTSLGDRTVDTEEYPVALVFATDADRKHVAKLLTDMPDGDHENGCPRIFAMMPDGMVPEARDMFMDRAKSV